MVAAARTRGASRLLFLSPLANSNSPLSLRVLCPSIYFSRRGVTGVKYAQRGGIRACSAGSRGVRALAAPWHRRRGVGVWGGGGRMAGGLPDMRPWCSSWCRRWPCSRQRSAIRLRRFSPSCPRSGRCLLPVLAAGGTGHVPRYLIDAHPRDTAPGLAGRGGRHPGNRRGLRGHRRRAHRRRSRSGPARSGAGPYRIVRGHR